MIKLEGRLVGVMNDRTRPKVKTADDAYRHLFRAIADQRLAPGTKLTEFALVESFGVSRRVIGVALQRLAWEQLVVTLPNRGAYVAAPEADEVREIFAARLAIEAGTTEAVARTVNESGLAQLHANLAEERKLREQGRVREAIHLSGGFHVLIAELSKNRVLSEQVRLLVARTSLVISLFENRSGLAGWHDHHDELVRLCASRRIDAAVALMKEHICELEDGILLDSRRPTAFDPVRVFSTALSD
jgi:DNA-binding GntR family transcriptional regulator